MFDDIGNQDEFNQRVSQALSNLYSVAVIAPSTIAAGEEDAEGVAERADIQLRHDMALIQNYAFRPGTGLLADGPSQ